MNTAPRLVVVLELWLHSSVEWSPGCYSASVQGMGWDVFLGLESQQRDTGCTLLTGLGSLEAG